MAQWGKTDNAANSVLYAADQFNVKANSTSRTNLYGNTTVGAFVAGKAVGQFGIDATEKANTSSDLSYAAHSGWNLRTVGTGQLRSQANNGLVVTVGGTGYSNTDLVLVQAPTGTGTVNASATIATNATGGITSVTITNRGAGFIAVNPTVTVTNASGGASAGSGATIVATAGGRAGRISYETLVASGSIV